MIGNNHRDGVHWLEPKRPISMCERSFPYPPVKTARTTMLKRKEFILGAAVGLTFAAAATAGGVITWPGAEAAPAAKVGQLVPSAGAGALAFAPPPGAPLSSASIFQQVAPAVVQIDVRTRVQRPRGGVFQIPGFGSIPIPGAPGGSAEGEEDNTQLAAGAGSGFFISADGFI